MESNWRTNIILCGVSGPGPIWAFGNIKLALIARLVTPILVSGVPYQWLIEWRYPSGFTVFLGRSPVNDYIEYVHPFFPPGTRFPYGLAVHPD